jgi:hypothetical protein
MRITMYLFFFVVFQIQKYTHKYFFYNTVQQSQKKV